MRSANMTAPADARRSERMMSASCQRGTVARCGSRVHRAQAQASSPYGAARSIAAPRTRGQGTLPKSVLQLCIPRILSPLVPRVRRAVEGLLHRLLREARDPGTEVLGQRPAGRVFETDAIDVDRGLDLLQRHEAALEGGLHLRDDGCEQPEGAMQVRLVVHDRTLPRHDRDRVERLEPPEALEPG